MEIRKAIHDLVDEMIDAVLLVAYQIRAVGDGWSNDKKYAGLFKAQKIWLDDIYKDARKEDAWLQEIAASFARWVITYEKLWGRKQSVWEMGSGCLLSTIWKRC